MLAIFSGGPLFSTVAVFRLENRIFPRITDAAAVKKQRDRLMRLVLSKRILYEKIVAR